ncbi:MAG: hypothetical protein ACOY7T_08200 [Pseudomonadota bacterium]
MDDLIERNKAWSAAMGRGDALSADFVSALLAENSARIATLEALVKEAGDRLHRYFYALDEGLDEYDAEKDLRTTLARIKENSRAD